MAFGLGLRVWGESNVRAGCILQVVQESADLELPSTLYHCLQDKGLGL